MKLKFKKFIDHDIENPVRWTFIYQVGFFRPKAKNAYQKKIVKQLGDDYYFGWLILVDISGDKKIKKIKLNHEKLKINWDLHADLIQFVKSVVRLTIKSYKHVLV